MEDIESTSRRTGKSEWVELLRIFFIYFFCFLGVQKLWDFIATGDWGHSRIIAAAIFAGLTTYLAPVTIRRKAN